jgi:mRNA interferase RelE/StbE
MKLGGTRSPNERGALKRITFTEQARVDVRRLDIPTAMRLFRALDRLIETGSGDVKKLEGNTDELRLRVGDWRIRFTESPGGITVKRVLHRSEAYR